jgi:hypothetical protein
LNVRADRSDTSIHEIYAKSSVVAKKTSDEEMHMQVGRKDASLTDAELKSTCL